MLEVKTAFFENKLAIILRLLFRPPSLILQQILHWHHCTIYHQVVKTVQFKIAVSMAYIVITKSEILSTNLFGKGIMLNAFTCQFKPYLTRLTTCCVCSFLVVT